MALREGVRLGVFQVLGPLGAGGMGEVYRARDTKLGREVAVKVLPEDWKRDPERLARIDREARVLASLNHPNIASLFGYEEVDGVRFLAMEYIPGDTLADRVAKGPLPIPEAVAIGRQIAEALEEAHGKSVIHRDLKPANVKVTPEGRVKVLDFGLAKALAPLQEGLSGLDTLTQSDSSKEGLIAGTIGYMSPEQARGQPLDAKTDVWSFGCVLYEMLTGRRAFLGPTPSDTFAAVLQQELDLSRLPEATPPAVRTLLRRCLEKDRRRRLQSVGDARLELEEAFQGEMPPSAAAASPRRRSARTYGIFGAAVVVALMAGLAGGFLVFRRPMAGDPWIPRRLVLPIPKAAEIHGFGGLAVSPAGDRVVYVAGTGETGGLYLQDLTAFEPRLVMGTEGGAFPSFSPDGRWIAFQSKGFFRKVPVEGGEPISLCAAPEAVLPAWPRQDLMLFAEPSTGALMSVSANGGQPEVFLKIDGTSVLVEPDPLPGGKGVFLTMNAANAGPSGRSLAVLDLDTRKWKTIQKPSAAYAHYLPTRHVLYNATVVAEGPGPAPPDRWVLAPFDLERLQITGPAVDILGDLRTGGYQLGWVTPHASGLLAYTAVASAAPIQNPLAWIDTAGTRTAFELGGREFVPFSLALSPDAKRLAVSLRDGTAFDLWVNDLERGTWQRLTVDGQSQSPLWSPDGARIAFVSGKDKKDLFWIPSDGSGKPELLAKAGTPELRPTSFSPDGKRLLFAKGRWDGPPRSVGILLYTLDLAGDREPRVLIDAPYPVTFGAYSPDGRWLALVTLESGRGGLDLRRADLTGRRWALTPSSAAWAAGPAWSSSSRELYFQDRGRLMSVPIHPDTGPGTARVVLEPVFSNAGWDLRSFEVGEGRFLVGQAPPNSAAAATRPTHVVVIPNWLDEVRARTRVAP